MSALKTRICRLEERATAGVSRRVGIVLADSRHDSEAIQAALCNARINLGWDGAIIMRVPGSDLSVKIAPGR
jgi:hypothetical protein